MAEREELVIRTYSEEEYLALKSTGNLITREGELFLLRDPAFLKGVKLTEYTLTRSRMGMPELSAKLKCERCLDQEWTGREYVECMGERYYLRLTPSSKKDSTDMRYVHDLVFESEREILNHVLFFDVASIRTDTDYKPRTNCSEFSFYGTLREFVGRINCALAYLGIADSCVYGDVYPEVPASADDDSYLHMVNGNGYVVMLDGGGGYAIDEDKELQFEDQYIWEALRTAFETYGVPFSVRGRVIIFGEREHVVPTELAYGPDRELTGSGRVNKGERIINEATAVGSDENIPYYYPNMTEYGNVSLHVDGALNDADFEIVDAVRMTAVMKEGVPMVSSHADAAEGKMQTTDTNGSGMWRMNIWPESSMNHWETHFMRDHVVDNRVVVSSTCTIPAYSTLVPGNNAAVRKVKFSFNFSVNQYSQYSMKIEGTFTGTGIRRGEVSLVQKMADITVTDSEPDGIELGKRGDELVMTLHGGTHTLECDFYIPTVEQSFKLTKVEITGKDGARDFWTYEGKEVRKLGSYGIIFRGELSEETQGATVCWRHDEGSRIQTQTKLMVPKYRRTMGAKRFYKAINWDTNGGYFEDGFDWVSSYTSEDNIPYHFPNPYDGIPSQKIYRHDEIKPTIVGVRNINNELFGEIAAVAFDDNDNDLVVDGSDESEGKYQHSFFYIKLHKFAYVDETDGTDWGIDLFKSASQKDAMTICMTSGRCAGCKFKVQALEGTGENAGIWQNPVQTTPNGDIVSGDYSSKVGRSAISANQNSETDEIWIALQKDTETFGVVMPNRANEYLPEPGDKFNIVNINLPHCYILAAERRLEQAMMDDMLADNEERFTMEPVLSRIWCVETPEMTSLIDEYSVVNVCHGSENRYQYVTSVTLECKDSEVLPSLKVELSDEIEGGHGIIQAIRGEVAKIGRRNPSGANTKQPAYALAPKASKAPSMQEIIDIVDLAGIGGDYTQTVIDDGVVTTGTILLKGADNEIKAGITGHMAPEGEGSPENDDGDIRIWAGASYADRAGAPFSVTQNGVLRASKAIIGGALYADSLTLGSGACVIAASEDLGIILPQLAAGVVRSVDVWILLTSRNTASVTFITANNNTFVGENLRPSMPEGYTPGSDDPFGFMASKCCHKYILPKAGVYKVLGFGIGGWTYWNISRIGSSMLWGSETTETPDTVRGLDEYTILEGGELPDFPPSRDPDPQAPDQCEAPIITLNLEDRYVTFSCMTNGANIFYTMGDESPTSSSALYERGSQIPLIGESGTVKAIAIKEGLLDSAISTKYYSFAEDADRCATPAITVNTSGRYATISCATSGATIYYALDDDTQSYNFAVYSGQRIPIEDSGVIRAYARKQGLEDSEIERRVYALAPGHDDDDVATPVITVNETRTVATISCATYGAEIRYTLNGSTPTSASTLYDPTERIALTSDTGIIKAIAMKYGYNNSSVAVKQYGPDIEADTTVATPVITINHAVGDVFFNCATEGATIYYTTDGRIPTPYPSQSTASCQPGGGINVRAKGDTVTIKAIAVKEGLNDSAVATAVFEYDPDAADDTQVPETPQMERAATPRLSYADNTVTMECDTEGANIHYTLDGANPEAAYTDYTGPFGLDHKCRIKAYATKEGYYDSLHTVEDYIPLYSESVATPVIEVFEDGNVHMSCATEGAVIYYTLNGNTPDTFLQSATGIYTKGFNVSKREQPVIIKAIATKDRYNDSEMAVAQYPTE